MPEWAETRLMSEFVDRTITNRTIVSITKNPKSKNADLALNPNVFPATAAVYHRGKETLLIFMPKLGVKGWSLRVQYGMSGHWEHHKTQFGNKHSLLSLELSSGTFLEFVDPRRFGRWKLGKYEMEWSSQCPDLFSSMLPTYIKLQQKLPNFGKKLLCDIMLDQKVWFGIGNYLRAEIIDRANINPFKPFKDVSEDEMTQLIEITRQVITESYNIGGGKLFTWKNPLTETPSASTWLKCYKVKDWCIDASGRRFWFDSKWFDDCPYSKVDPKKIKKEAQKAQ